MVRGFLSFILFFGSMASLVLAQESAEPQSGPAAVSAPATASPPAALDKGDQAWMLASAAFVLLMTPGLAFFYGGLVGRKNVLSILMQCFMCMALITVLWVTVGYSLFF